MSTALIEHNRRAVYTALSGVCADRLLLERSFAFWEANFAAQGVFRVAQYIDGLMGHVGLNQEQRRSLSIALYAALNRQDQELAELPAIFRRTSNGQAGAAKSAAATPATRGRPAPTVILAKVLSGIVDGATRAGLQEDLVAALGHSTAKVSAATQHALEQWVEGSLADSIRFAGHVAEAEGASVVNAVYVALCEAAGPVGADRILHRAVEAAEQLAEAVSFSPRSLL